MNRLSLGIATVASAVALFALAGAATATAHSAQSCNARSANVVGHKIKAKLATKNVDPSQARYATCAYAKKVIGGLTSLRIEEPKVVKGFRCTPKVLSTEPDVVDYSCLFRGADTATEITIDFKVKYDLD